MVSEMPSFDSSATTIDEYIEELEDYMNAHHGECAEKRMLSALKTAIGDEGRKVIKNLNPHQRSSYENLKAALRDQFHSRQLVFVERNSFFKMYMDESEPIDNYATRLRTQAGKCEFRILCTPAVPATTGANAKQAEPAKYHDLTDEFIRDRVIVTISDEFSKQQLLQKNSDLTLEDTLALVRSAEEAKKNMKRIEDERSTRTISALSTYGSKRQSTSPTENSQNSQNKPQKGDARSRNPSGQDSYFCAKYCGTHHVRGNCPAYGHICDNCKRKNHYTRVCRSSGGNKDHQAFKQVQVVAEDVHRLPSRPTTPSYPNPSDHYNSSTSDPYWNNGLFLGAVEMVSPNCEVNQVSTEWFEEIQLNGKSVKCKIDTGAQANVVALATVGKIVENPEFTIADVKLRAYNNTIIPCIGKIRLNAKINDIEASDLQFYVVPFEAKTIIGLPSSVELGLVRTSNDNTDDKTDPQVCECADEVRPQTETAKANVRCDESTTPPFSERIEAKYPNVFDNTRLGRIKGAPYDIKLSSDAEPVVDASRSVPFALQEKVIAELKRMEDLGVITPVDAPTDWVNSMVVVQRGEKTRICLDPTSLNRFIKREHLTIPSPDELLGRIGTSKIFAKLDLKDGYWQVAMTEEASHLTTFNTPVGRYRYLVLPFGLTSANEVFQKRVSILVDTVVGAECIYDDILIHADDAEQLYRIVDKVVHRMDEAGVKLNKKKCSYGVTEVKYLGHLITSEGIKPDPEKISDILQMPNPTDKAGVQRLLGSITYLAKFIPNLSTITTPIRQLLNRRSKFEWTHEHEKAIQVIKECLTSSPVLAYYEVNDPVTIMTDASGTGLGACILQNDRPVAYASRSLTDCEKSYATIEKEMLGIAFGCERFHQYIFAKKVKCQTDHQPLVTVFKRPFQRNPVRLQRLLLRLQRYDLDVTFIPGKQLAVADMLSRAPVDHDQTDIQRELEEDCELVINTVMSRVNCTAGMMDKLRQASADDPTLSSIRQYIQTDWPTEPNKCKVTAKVYWKDRAELTAQDGLILYQDRIVIPKSLQSEILGRIHEGHQGQVRCKSLARQSVYWKGIGSDITRLVSGCPECLSRRKAPAREPLIPHEIPNEPWRKLACDLFSFGGKKYQLIVDYYSKWVEVKGFSSTPTSRSVINHLKSVFSQFGYPLEICSDGDSLYTSHEFTEFCKSYGIDCTNSSARYARSNGQSERKVGFIKDLLAKCGPDKLDDALLQYRSTPLGPGLGSPAELNMRRSVRTRIPSIADNGAYSRQIKDNKQYHDRLLENQERMKYYHDRVCKVSNRSYRPGDLVRYRDDSNQSWTREGQITASVNSRSHELVNSRGNVIRRNGRLLQPDLSATSLPARPLYQPAHVTPPHEIRASVGQIPHPSAPHSVPTQSQTPIIPDQAPPVTVPRRSERIRNLTNRPNYKTN